MPEPLTALLIALVIVAALVALYWPERGLLPRLKRGREYAQRVLREDALKHIHKCEEDGLPPTLESLAGALQTSTDEVAGLLSTLREVGLIKRIDDLYQLTPEGRDYALRIIRAHRLWERYLADHTGFGEMDWHRQAEKKEHQFSGAEVEALAKRLGHPTHDPHGDPIPSASGAMQHHEGQSLTTAPLDRPLRIVHIEDEPEIIYAQLLAAELHPGMVVRVVERNEQSVRFWADDRECTLAPVVASNISVGVDQSAQSALEQLSGSCRLSDLAIGEKGRIVQLSSSLRGLPRRRLMDLGFLPGTVIEAELGPPGNDPIAYRVRGTLLALRQEQARQIHITKDISPEAPPLDAAETRPETASDERPPEATSTSTESHNVAP